MIHSAIRLNGNWKFSNERTSENKSSAGKTKTTSERIRSRKSKIIYGGENRSRTCIGLRPEVFKTSAIPLCDLSASRRRIENIPQNRRRNKSHWHFRRALDSFALVSTALPSKFFGTAFFAESSRLSAFCAALRRRINKLKFGLSTMNRTQLWKLWFETPFRRERMI